MMKRSGVTGGLAKVKPKDFPPPTEKEWREAMDQQRELNDTMHERARDETCKE